MPSKYAVDHLANELFLFVLDVGGAGTAIHRFCPNQLFTKRVLHNHVVSIVSPCPSSAWSALQFYRVSLKNRKSGIAYWKPSKSILLKKKNTISKGNKDICCFIDSGMVKYGKMSSLMLFVMF